jgi:hypothetical protein
MRLRRGTSPTLYDLFDGGRRIGSIRKARDGTVVLWLHGFLTPTDAASAASLAYAGRLAYEAQGAAAGSVPNATDRRRFSPSMAGGSGGTTNYTEGPNNGTMRLCFGEVEIAQLRARASAASASTWSARISLAGDGTPEVFMLAAARRMWEAVRRAGLHVAGEPAGA